MPCARYIVQLSRHPRARRVMSLTVLGLMSVVLMAGCVEQDPRSYPDSMVGRNLERAAGEFHVTLPACRTKDLRYFLADDTVFYLTFAAPEGCVRSFLEDINVPENPNSIVATDPFGQYEARKFGWHLSEPCRCTYYGQFISASVSVDIALVQGGSGDASIFLRAIDVG